MTYRRHIIAAVFLAASSLAAGYAAPAFADQWKDPDGPRVGCFVVGASCNKDSSSRDRNDWGSKPRHDYHDSQRHDDWRPYGRDGSSSNRYPGGYDPKPSYMPQRVTIQH